MKIATMTKDGRILLPKETVKNFNKSKGFLVWDDKESIILKPIKTMDVTGIPKRKKDKSPMTLKEISNEVHKCRRNYIDNAD